MALCSKKSTKYQKIYLKDGQKSVELIVNKLNNEARLRHQNDCLQLKYYIQLWRAQNPEYRSPEIFDSLKANFSFPLETMASYDNDKNKATDRNQGHCRSTKTGSYEIRDSGFINSSNRKSRDFDGGLSFLDRNNELVDSRAWGHLVQNNIDGKISKLQLECKGEDTWLKNVEDYNSLYNFVKNWEENNQDYISEFSCSHSDNSASKVCKTDSQINCNTSPRSDKKDVNNVQLNIMGNSGYDAQNSGDESDNLNDRVVNNVVHIECTNNGKKNCKNDFLSDKYGTESRDTEIDKSDKNYDEVLFYYSSNKDINDCDHEFKKNLKQKSQNFFNNNSKIQDRYKSNASNKVSN